MWFWRLLACGASPAVVPHGPTVQERFGDWGYLTPLDAPASVALLAGGEIASDPKTCGACHPAHYEEWSRSTHASAIRDLQYAAELAKSGQPRWLCLNCHVPTRPQRGLLIRPDTALASPAAIDRLVEAPEPSFDPGRVAEGVGCATCHVRRDSDGAGIIVGPRGSGRAPHRVRHDPGALERVCVSCHSPGPARISPTFTCWFETADEIAAGPFAGATCVGCHMPPAVRSPATGATEQEVRRHLWMGGGVPKSFDGYGWLAEAGWAPAIDVAVSLDPWVVRLTNARAAHRVPTSDPERHLRVTLRTLDAAGGELARETIRLGQHWDWGDEPTGRPAKRLADDRLLPGETRVLAPTLSLAGADRVEVEVANVRLTAENAGYMTQTALDAELVALWPESPALLAQMTAHYPLETTVFREIWPLAGGAPVRTELGDLLVEAAGAGFATP